MSATASAAARGLLRPVPRCPVCRHPERTAEDKASAPDPYTRAIASELGVDLDRIAATLPAFRCRRCDTLWSDPWLSAHAMSRVYAVACSRHGSGWRRFDRWRAGDDRKRRWAETLWDLLHHHVGPITRYAELNCPFWGLLPDLRDRELGATREATLDRDLEAMRASEPIVRTGPSSPVERTLILESTSCFWSHGCSRDGHSCRSVAGAILGAELVDFKDVAREGLRYDVVSLVNCLDHFVDPQPILDKAVACGRLVYVDGHSQEGPFRRQHPFVLGGPALERIGEDRWSVADVTPIVGSKNRQAHLISSELDLAGAG